MCNKCVTSAFAIAKAIASFFVSITTDISKGPTRKSINKIVKENTTCLYYHQRSKKYKTEFGASRKKQSIFLTLVLVFQCYFTICKIL